MLFLVSNPSFIYMYGFIRVASRLYPAGPPMAVYHRKAKNPVVVQCTGLDVSASLPCTLYPKEVGCKAREGMNLPARVRAGKERASPLHQKVVTPI